MSTPASADLTPEMDARFKAAKERAEQVQGLLIHLMVYTVVNLSLFIIDALSGDGWWFYWPLLGWGIGLVLHLLTLSAPVFSPGWAERRARRQLESNPR
jgi:hypothetical protein